MDTLRHGHIVSTPAADLDKATSHGPQTLRERWLALAALVFSCAWFALHFVSTAVYLMPVSQLTARLYPLARPYLFPYFRQEWALFAPDPNGKTKFIQFRCELKQPGGAIEVSPLFNASEPFYQRTWETRLGPGFKVHRALQMPFGFFGEDDSKSTEILKYLAKGKPDEEAKVEALAKERRLFGIQRGQELGGRVGSVACAKQFPDREILRTYVAFDILDARPYPLRHSADEFHAPLQRVELGWRAFDADLEIR
jgi:hypothetical protein